MKEMLLPFMKRRCFHIYCTIQLMAELRDWNGLTKAFIMIIIFGGLFCVLIC